jgi:hypothetical protein
MLRGVVRVTIVLDVLDRVECVPLHVAKISDTSSHPRLESPIWGFNPVNPVAEPKQYI